MQLCPCGSSENYSNCCGLYINQGENPPTPVALMRSRYCAYTQANIAYIESTQRGHASKNFNANQAKIWASKASWHSLEIIKSKMNKKNKTRAQVEFIARYYQNHQLIEQHEISQFKYIQNQWFYISGTLLKS